MTDLGEPTVRRLTQSDTDFQRAMFVQTVCWREDSPQVSLEQLLSIPNLALYVAGWGRPGDEGVVAVSRSGLQVGAAWYRLFDEVDHGFGYVSPLVPELGIAVRSEDRGRGVGKRLMSSLIELARVAGHPGLSLSVEDDNTRARRLYEALGFRPVGHVGTATTMLLEFRRG